MNNTAPLVIQVVNLWKRYGLPPLPWHKGSTDQWALQDLSFDLHTGESLGVIGINGSGKSTLLKVLAAITAATRGQVTIHKSLFSMIELNAGIHADLTGRENVRMLGAIMGLSRRDIHHAMAEIEDFCELGEWFDRPVRLYSSGMLVRLGFSVSIHVQAEILLMDEVLAVGDIGFQNKCLRQLEAYRTGQGSILLVSHNMQRIRRICDRTLLLHQGKQLFLGETEQAIQQYEALLHRQNKTTNPLSTTTDIHLQEIRFIHEERPLDTPFPQGGDLTLTFSLQVEHPLERPNIQVALENADSVSVVWESMDLEALNAGLHHFQVTWRDLRLKAGRYQVRLGVNMGHFSSKGFRQANAIHLDVAGPPQAMGIYQPHSSFVLLGGTHLGH